MPHLARHTVETTRSMRSKLVVGRRVSQDEPRKSLWLFSCNLPCKRCSEILPWPQTRIPPGEEDADDERLVLRIIRSTLPRRFSLPPFQPFSRVFHRFFLLFLLFYSRSFFIIRLFSSSSSSSFSRIRISIFPLVSSSEYQRYRSIGVFSGIDTPILFFPASFSSRE